MTAIGGSIQEVHLDGHVFSVAADGEGLRRLGGWENSYMPNGNGTGRLGKTRVGMKLEGLPLETDDDNGDAEVLQELANRKGFWPLAVVLASGKTYQGTGQITGEMQTSTQNQTTAVTLEGPGDMTPQN